MVVQPFTGDCPDFRGRKDVTRELTLPPRKWNVYVRCRTGCLCRHADSPRCNLPRRPCAIARSARPAVVGVALGALSILTALHWALALVPVAGIVLGWRAQRQIRAAPDEWTGLGLAKLGMGLSVGLWVLGYGWLLFASHRRGSLGLSAVKYGRSSSPIRPGPGRTDSRVGQSTAREEGVHQGLHAAAAAAAGDQRVHPLPGQRRVPVLRPQPQPTQDDPRSAAGGHGNHLHHPSDRRGRQVPGRVRPIPAGSPTAWKRLSPLGRSSLVEV